MQNDESSRDLEPGEGPNPEDDTSDMATEGAVHANTELRKRRSTRIVQAVPLMVTGVDALGRPFAERTSTLIINCHGCRYQSKHYVLKNMWVNLEVPHPEPGHAPRRVRGKVAWIQRPRTVRQLFQVALELETAGNAWGIGFPPEDWFGFPEDAPMLANPASAGDLPPAVGSLHPLEAPLPIIEAEPGVATSDNIRVFPAPASATDASLQLARQMARLLGEAKQQIHASAREAAVQAVSAERRQAFEQWDQKYSALREELARETALAIGTIQEETEARVRTAQAAAAESLKNELPRWLAPQLEQLTHELTAHLAREGALQRDLHEKQLANAQDTLHAAFTQAEGAAARLQAQVQQTEAEVAAWLEVAAKRAEQDAHHQEQLAGSQKESLAAAVAELQGRAEKALEEAQAVVRSQIALELEAAQGRWQSSLESTLHASREQAAAALTDHSRALREELKHEAEQRGAAVRESLDANAGQLEETLRRAREATDRLEHHAERIETVQQQAIGGFQSQLDDVLTLHRNELHRRSESLFEEIHARIHGSFEAANSAALENFDKHIESLVQPHVTQAEQAIHRLAGGRSLLDAALTMQQDRIRNSADEAFAESLARFRDNLGSVEQLLNESAQTITSRNLEELETKTIDLKHRAMEEMFKSAEWYEKKTQAQLQHISERVVAQSEAQLREKAGEISGLFAGELDHASRGYASQAQQQMEESVRDSFERARLLFAEAADTTSAAFTDEIQRNARQELDGFHDLTLKSLGTARERLEAARLEINQQVSVQQEEFLRRFEESAQGAVDRGIAEANVKVQRGFDELLESWKGVSEAKQAELRGGFAKVSDEAAGQYRDRLENISNSWMVATVTTLDHQSRDVIAKIAATAEERLREASAEVFARFGDTLRERLQQIAQGFDKPDKQKS